MEVAQDNFPHLAHNEGVGKNIHEIIIAEYWTQVREESFGEWKKIWLVIKRSN